MNQGQPEPIEFPERPGLDVGLGETLQSLLELTGAILRQPQRMKIPGKWAGGLPILGYNVDPASHKLVVNEEESRRVRAIFELYRREQNLAWVVEELNNRGWVNKRWRT